jgi:hypothetical protein
LKIEAGRTPKPTCDSKKPQTGDKFMTSNHIFVLIFFSVLLFISGCSSVGGDVAAGLNALQTGLPKDAVG